MPESQGPELTILILARGIMHRAMPKGKLRKPLPTCHPPQWLSVLPVIIERQSRRNPCKDHEGKVALPQWFHIFANITWLLANKAGHATTPFLS